MINRVPGVFKINKTRETRHSCFNVLSHAFCKLSNGIYKYAFRPESLLIRAKLLVADNFSLEASLSLAD